MKPDLKETSSKSTLKHAFRLNEATIKTIIEYDCLKRTKSMIEYQKLVLTMCNNFSRQLHVLCRENDKHVVQW